MGLIALVFLLLALIVVIKAVQEIDTRKPLVVLLKQFIEVSVILIVLYVIYSITVAIIGDLPLHR